MAVEKCRNTEREQRSHSREFVEGYCGHHDELLIVYETSPHKFGLGMHVADSFPCLAVDLIAN